MTNTDDTKPTMTHTPGPWSVQGDIDDGITVISEPCLDEHVCQVFGGDALEANASLIAAAPAQRIVLDLLQLGLATIDEGELEFDGVMYWFDHRCPHWATAVVDAIGWDHARAAIAEATPA